jgi:hypothetical protein
MDPFPAITRAAQRFHALRDTSWHKAVDGRDDAARERQEEAVETTIMWRLARDLEYDLALIRSDVDEIHSDVVADTMRVVDSVGMLTAAFARGKPFSRWSEAKPISVKRVGSVESILAKRSHSRSIRRGKTRRVVLRTSSTNGASALTTPVTVEARTSTSRASRLAIEALSATTIQRATRQFLYSSLYTSGGITQLRTAQAMQRQSRLRRWLRRWRRLVVRRIRLRRRLTRRGVASESNLVARCIERAMCVVETDGKFAQAKEFHRLRLLGNVVLAWMNATATVKLGE